MAGKPKIEKFEKCQIFGTKIFKNLKNFKKFKKIQKNQKFKKTLLFA